RPTAAARGGRTTPRAAPRPLRPARRWAGMARRSAGTGARTPTASPPGARPAGPWHSGPAPARPPWRPSAARATNTDAGFRRLAWVGNDGATAPGATTAHPKQCPVTDAVSAPGRGRSQLGAAVSYRRPAI